MKRICVFLFISVTMFLACGESGPGGSLFYKGQDYLKNGRPMEALQAFTELDSLKPDSVYGQFGLGLYFKQEKLNLDAENSFDTVLAHRPGFIPGLIEGARLALEMNDPIKAHKWAEKAYRTDNENIDVLAVYAEALRKMGSPGEAEALLIQANNLSPDNPTLYLAGARLYLQTGKPDSALWTCGKITKKMNPDPAQVRAIGDIYSRLGMADSAAFYYENAYKRSKGDFYLKADLADAFIEIGYMNRARKIISELREITTDSYRIYLAEKRIAELQGDYRRADLVMVDAYSIFPERPTALVDIAEVKFKLYQPDQAYRFYQLAIDREAYDGFSVINNQHLRMERAERLFEEGHVSSGSSRITDILDNPGNDFNIVRVCALYYVRMAEPDKVRPLLKKLERMSEQNPWQMFMTARTYLTLDSLQTAGALYDKIHDIYSFEPEYIQARIDLYGAHEGTEQCLAYIDSLPEGIGFYRPVAKTKFELLMSLGQYDKALAFSEEFIDHGPEAVERYQMAFRAAEALGDSEEAEKIITMCLDNIRDDPDALSFAAEYFYDKGNNARTGELVESILIIDSMSIPAHLIMARMLKHEGRIDSVKSIYQRIIGTNDFVGEALSGLAWIEMDSDGDMNQAVNFANRAVRADGEEPFYLYTRAMAYNKQGRYDLARPAFENVLKRVPDNPLYNYQAGVNYLDEGKKPEAKKYLKKAIELGLRDDLKKEAERLLTGMK